MAPAVVIDGVSKRFQLKHQHSVRELTSREARAERKTEVVDALADVSLTVEEGDGLALMGLNGSGKSTLLKLIAGIMQPDTGRVWVRGDLAGLIDVGAGMSPELTGRENLYLSAAILGMTKAQTEARFDAIVDFAGIERFLDTEVKYYSSGMFMRIAFAVAIHTDPQVFLVDEVLAVGDSQFKRKCRRALLARRREGLTLIIVAHDVDLLRRLCTRAVVLEKGKLIADGTLKEAELLLTEDDD